MYFTSTDNSYFLLATYFYSQQLFFHTKFRQVKYLQIQIIFLFFFFRKCRYVLSLFTTDFDRFESGKKGNRITSVLFRFNTRLSSVITIILRPWRVWNHASSNYELFWTTASKCLPKMSRLGRTCNISTDILVTSRNHL